MINLNTENLGQKRDWNLLRRILLRMEEEDAYNDEGTEQTYGPKELGIDGYSQKTVSYHIYLLGSGGYLQTATLRSGKAKMITYAGHDLLDLIRDETVWGRIHPILTETGGTIETIRALVEKLYR